jgi:DNA-binding Lrp family transcriptional regulator
MTVRAYILMKVSSGIEREVCKRISEYDEVLDVSIIYGEFDIIAKVQVENLEQLEVFISEKIRSIPTIMNLSSESMITSTMIVAREYKGKNKRNSLKVENY